MRRFLFGSTGILLLIALVATLIGSWAGFSKTDGGEIAVVRAMRVALFALALALIELAVLWVRKAGSRLRQRSTWRVASYSDGGGTTVALRLTDPAGAVLDEHVVASVPGDAFDWQRSLLQAQLEAESRAMRLNGRRSA